MVTNCDSDDKPSPSESATRVGEPDAKDVNPGYGMTQAHSLVMLSGSITVGYGPPAGEALPAKLEAALHRQGFHAAVVNAGVSGDTTGGALRRFDWALSRTADARAVIIIDLNQRGSGRDR